MPTDPDYASAQRMLRAAMHDVITTCGFTNEVFEFCVVLCACHAAVLAEIVPLAKLTKPDGIDEAAETFSAQLREMLVDAMKQRLDHGRKDAH